MSEGVPTGPGAVDNPTGDKLRISPDGLVVADELVGNPRGDWFLYVRGVRIAYTTNEKNPEIASWPLLKAVVGE